MCVTGGNSPNEKHANVLQDICGTSCRQAEEAAMFVFISAWVLYVCCSWHWCSLLASRRFVVVSIHIRLDQLFAGVCGSVWRQWFYVLFFCVWVDDKHICCNSHSVHALARWFSHVLIELRTQSYWAFDALFATILTTAVAAVEPDGCAVSLFGLCCLLCLLALEIAAWMCNLGGVFL